MHEETLGRVYQKQMAKLKIFARGTRRTAKWTGLARYLTFSYIGITVASFLLLEVLLAITSVIFNHLIYQPFMVMPAAKQAAQHYAQGIARQLEGKGLDPHLTFEPGQPTSIDMTDLELSSFYQIKLTRRKPPLERVHFALVMQPNGRILASTIPAYYPPSAIVDHSMLGIRQAQRGTSMLGTERLSSVGLVAYALRPIYNGQHTLIGMVYVQCVVPSIIWLEALPQLLLLTNILLLVVVTPIGLFFSALTVYKPVRRLRQLVQATTYFADGDYAHRVQVTQHDEIGQLEHQLNRMAERMVESMERQKELSEQNARLSERARIARELHDAISQDLFSLSILAGGLQGALEDSAALHKELALIEQTTGKVIREMRALLLELHPPQLEHLGLVKALEELTFTYGMRLGVIVQTNLTPVSLSCRMEQILLRIVQEALTNAVRHANARTITVSLTAHEKQVELCVTDDGQGFSPEQARARHGLGLRLIEERTQEINGVLQLKSSPGQGTQINIQIPQGAQDDTCSHCG